MMPVSSILSSSLYSLSLFTTGGDTMMAVPSILSFPLYSLSLFTTGGDTMMPVSSILSFPLYSRALRARLSSNKVASLLLFVQTYVIHIIYVLLYSFFNIIYVQINNNKILELIILHTFSNGAYIRWYPRTWCARLKENRSFL